jgi:hypothetical protein
VDQIFGFISRWQGADELRQLVLAVLRGWRVLLAGGLVMSAIGIGYGFLSPSLYETRTMIALKAAPPPNAPIRLMQSGALRKPPAGHLKYLQVSLLSDEVLGRVITDHDLVSKLLPNHPGATVRDAMDYVRNEVVRTSMSISRERLLVSVQVRDPEFAVEFPNLLIAELSDKIRREAQREAETNRASLEAMLATAKDPLISQRLRDRIERYNEAAFLANTAVLDVLRNPLIPKFRAKPVRKQILALCLLLGTLASIGFIWLRDPASRGILLGTGKGIVHRLPFPNPEKFGLGRHVLAMALLFLHVYNVSFQVFPSLTTSRIAMVGLLAVALGASLRLMRDLVRNHLLEFLVFGYLLIYGFTAFRLNPDGDSTQFSRLFHFLFYSILGSVAYLSFIGFQWRRFHLHFMAIVVLVQGGNLDLSLGSRPPGFVNSAGAAFSVIQALGLFSALFILRASKSRWMTFVSAGLGVIIFISALVAGRTGMLVCMAMLLFSALTGSVKSRYATIFIFMSIISGLAFFSDYLRFYLFVVDPAFERDFSKMLENVLEVFQNQGKVKSVSHIYSMEVPPLTFETLIGTGRSRASIGGGHDSGYVQIYYSLGLVMAGVFYGVLAFFLGRLLAAVKERKIAMGMLIVLMFTVEAKEPFIFKYVLPFYIVSCLLLLISQGKEKERVSG